jgi:alanyl-tRNA synthetase
MKTAEIRQRWLDFFAERGHAVVPSASLVSDDPTLMFTVAGMVPFVPYLTGEIEPPFTRATSVQKCIRTNDIEEVGKTPRHGTFFQMNGNFSFGDYFKEGAIRYAWELLTTAEDRGGYGFNPSDLWVTVYEDDVEAIELWKSIAQLPDERIQRLGRETNFWTTGQSGPGGPCSEIFFDRGPAYGVDGGPATDDDRYVEIWNLVFMQYLVDEVRSKTDFRVVGELPQKNIDTGMGLERVAFLKQGVENMYEIDQVRPVLDIAASLAGVTYGAQPEDDVRLRVIADHVRSGLMLVNDGVTPSNEGRGYILRRLLRRVVRSMRLLGVESASFPALFAASRDAMVESYPELEENFAFISQIVEAEEQTFLRTLAAGTLILEEAVSSAQQSKNKELSGETAFLLHDTFGFPIELTMEVAAESGLQTNREVFNTLMQGQRERAKADAKAKKASRSDVSVYKGLRSLGETQFVGYDTLEAASPVLGILVDGVESKSAQAGQFAEVILAETALWAEAGGQAADKGTIVGDSFALEVVDVQRPVPGLVSHTVKVLSGEVGVGDQATTMVDPDYRLGATQAHSATHIVHAALRQTLGESAHQAGSFNKAGFMRLDFSWGQALSDETRSEIEEMANLAVRANHEVITRELPLEEAKAMGAMALFGEKYGERVRMVDIGGAWSRELCAGTHVSTSAQVGIINLVSEHSIGSSARRIESLVGMDALQAFISDRVLVEQLISQLKVPHDEVLIKLEHVTSQLKAAEKRIAEQEQAKLNSLAPALAEKVQDLGSYSVVSENIGALASADELRTLALAVRTQLANKAAVVLLAATVESKPVVIVATTDEARSAGANAGALAKVAAAILGGGGGGKPDLAQGGGADAQRIPQALSEALKTLKE